MAWTKVPACGGPISLSGGALTAAWLARQSLGSHGNPETTINLPIAAQGLAAIDLNTPADI